LAIKPGNTLLVKRKSFRYTLILLLLLLAAYAVSNQLLDFKMPLFAESYVLPTLIWGVIIAAVAWLPDVQPQGKLRLRRMLRRLALMCVFIALLGMMLHIAMGEFGKNPYDRSARGILINLVSCGAAVLGMEMGRAWLLNRHFGRHPFIGMSLVSMIFAVFSFPLSRFASLGTGKALIEFLGQEFLPAVGQSFLASYLAWLGGAAPAAIYRGGLSALEHFSPIIPDTGWVSQTLFGVLAPVLGLIMVRLIYGEEARTIRSASREDSHLAWTLTSLAAIIIVWFSMGVFSYKPKVIVTGSMQPLISPGDIVIVHKIEGRQAKTGDIVMFPHNDMKVTHRIVAVNNEEGQTTFTTKGDANPSPDSETVLADNVQGKVVQVIPKLGKITMLLRGDI
jgi:signal peptidase